MGVDAPRTSAVPLLVVDGLCKRFGGLDALDGASFGVARHSITALIGPNGAGKTTLFNVVTGFHRADAGQVTYDGSSIFRKPAHAIARRGLVRTFQITKALAALSVLDNMRLAAPRQPGERLSRLAFSPRASRRREREVHDCAVELLELVGLRAKAEDYAGTLSGGQRKLLELARALMVEPVMVLLDEPMAGVNPTLGSQLLDHIEALRDRAGITFLFIEHDMDVVMNRSDRVIVMANGSVIAQGPPQAIRDDPQVLTAYLGDHAPSQRHEPARS
ncbi:MAG: branched-chain amino acid transport system ATP-binding protein [Solirubrobacteraceae bacterium]